MGGQAPKKKAKSLAAVMREIAVDAVENEHGHVLVNEVLCHVEDDAKKGRFKSEFTFTNLPESVIQVLIMELNALEFDMGVDRKRNEKNDDVVTLTVFWGEFNL